MLEFIIQTNGKTDPALKRKVRQHARNYVSKSKGVETRAPLLKFHLIVPESFGSISQSGGSPIPPTSFPEQSEIADDFQHGKLEVGDRSSPSYFQYNENDGGRDLQGESQSQDSTWSSPNVLTSGFDDESQRQDTPTKSKTRTPGPKVPSRCWTCKARHVKCDETKPACLRCLRLAGECMGYPSKKRNGGQKSMQALASKMGASEIIFHQPSIGLPFMDETESLYFKYFREETATELSGVFKSSIWNRILLQESHHKPYVRQALAAIAALSKSAKTFEFAEANKEARKERGYALDLYGKALQGMQLISRGQTPHLREVVIAILLVFVFETISQQPDIAYSHALIADRLLCQFVETTPYLITRYEGISSPATHIIESELLMTYTRLDTQLMTFVDLRSLYVHDMGKMSCRDTVKEMSESFASLKEATLYWEVVMRRSGHYILSTSAINGSSIFAREFVQAFTGKTIELNAQTSIYGSPYVVPESLNLQRSCYVSGIEKWSSIFTPLFYQLQHDQDIQTRTAVMLLRLYSLTMRIVVEGTTFTSETKYDEFLDEFREIISLAWIISNNLLDITQQRPTFHFQLSIVPPLFILLQRCRDGGLRREAIDVLRKCQYDGPWDRYLIAAVGKWIMESEEAREEDGFIPEAARLRLSRMSINMESRSVIIQCVRRHETAGLEDDQSRLEWFEMMLDGPWR